MNDELLMDLADCGSPEALIAVILRHHPGWSRRVPLEDLARSVGIIDFQDLEVDGFEGALMTNPEKSRGVILTRAGQREERRRFTVGHELGHFLMPSHRGNRQCKASDLREHRRDTVHQRQELEANRFAAGLLMPKPSFVRDMRSLGDADVMHVQHLAGEYGTSLEATVNRYVELTEDRCAFVFSKDGVIRYVRFTAGFPRLAVSKGDRLPDFCSSLKAPAAALRRPTSWAELDGSVWLEVVWGERTPAVLEQSVRQRDGYQVTLLFVEAPSAGEDEEETDLENSWAVRFRR